MGMLPSGYDGYRTCTGAGRGWIQSKGTQTSKVIIIMDIWVQIRITKEMHSNRLIQIIMS